MSDRFARAAADSTPSRFVKFAYAAVGLVVFGAVLISNYPYSASLTKILAPMGLVVSSAGQSIAFPFGAELTGVRLTSTRSNAASPLIESPAVRITPSIISLLMFHPGVRVNASIYDGVMNVTLRPSGNGTAIDFDLDAVNLARQHLLATPGVAAAGLLSGRADLWMSGGDLESGSGSADLSAKGLEVAPGAGIPAIRLGQAHARFKLDGGQLTIQELKTNGGDLSVNASGTILLAQDPSQSTIDVQFTLVPSPAASSQLAILFATLPHPPGPRPYQLSGALSAPRLS